MMSHPPARTRTSPPPALSRLRCIACGREYPLSEVRYQCDACSDLLEVVHDLDRLKTMRAPSEWRELFAARRAAARGIDASGVWRYR